MFNQIYGHLYVIMILMEPCREKTCLQGKSHVRLNPTCSDTETRWQIIFLHEESLDILLSNKQIKKH